MLLSLIVLIISNPSPVAGTPSSSAWLKKVSDPRAVTGCWKQPWICNRGEKGGVNQFPPAPFVKRMCCKNRCVEVSSDINNCGLCGIRCPFTWQCCNGLCIDTNINPFHCGQCWKRCQLGSLCFYGMCGYAQPLPPFPFPFPPKLPKPPKPYPPHFPFPPKPPKPFPPPMA
ncbi:stigma-specific STIG1-like protein 1 [Magnolia sinica]|uniref:stigma-specific STIG1-like protein 1 n=1 Tax=Magnolia sinica TaxID=86752 RepID=UPI0026599212|nr:stigma-specific STIG1-like protein 1 [Magnolia sinica]